MSGESFSPPQPGPCSARLWAWCLMVPSRASDGGFLMSTEFRHHPQMEASRAPSRWPSVGALPSAKALDLMPSATSTHRRTVTLLHTADLAACAWRETLHSGYDPVASRLRGSRLVTHDCPCAARAFLACPVSRETSCVRYGLRVRVRKVFCSCERVKERMSLSLIATLVAAWRFHVVSSSDRL